MPSLAQSVAYANLKVCRLQINKETKEIRSVPIYVAAAKKAGHPGPNCKCEACAGMYMQKTRDKRMKAMMPGNVDMGNRQPASMGSKKVKSNSALMMKVKAADYGMPKRHNKQVAPHQKTADSQKVSRLIHDRGIILKGKEFSDGQRSKLAKKHQAEPDGSYPIANVGDLKRAKQALGRSKNIAKTRKWINKRAKELNQPDIGAGGQGSGRKPEWGKDTPNKEKLDQMHSQLTSKYGGMKYGSMSSVTKNGSVSHTYVPKRKSRGSFAYSQHLIESPSGNHRIENF